MKSTKEEGAAIMKQLSEAVNCFNTEHFVTGLVDQLTQEHRSIQQGVIRVFTQVMIQWVRNKDYTQYTDERNIAAWKYCEEVDSRDPKFPII